MKNYENCPVNEWNSGGIQVGSETYWPWDVVVPRSSGSKETAAVNAHNKDVYPEAASRGTMHHKSVDMRATV